MLVLEEIASKQEIDTMAVDLEQSRAIGIVDSMMCMGSIIVIGHSTGKHPIGVRMAQLYHEIAHIKLGMTDPCTYDEERYVWTYCFSLMKDDNNVPSRDTLRACITMLNKYKDRANVNVSD